MLAVRISAAVLLDQLQSSVAEGERVRWDDSGHVRLSLGREREDAREAIAARLVVVPGEVVSAADRWLAAE